MPYDDEVWPIIDRTLVFATATRRRGRGAAAGSLNVRHLVAALLTDRRPLPAFAILGRAQRTQGGVLAQMRRSIEELADPNDDLARWAQIFDEHREEVFADYDNDEAHGEDRLDIDGDVRALAAVLASAHVAPPLSVGLFGDWGSGKSFFMKRLSARIAQLETAANARPRAESWFVGRRGYVVQIELNAWHYMDADLWSSLAVRVFDALSDRLEADFAKACAKNLTSLNDRKDTLEAEQREVDGQLAALRAQRAQVEITPQQYLEGIKREVARDPRVEAAVKTLELQREAVVDELEDAKRDLYTVAGAAARVWRAWRSPMRMLVFGSVLLLPLITLLATWSFDRLAAEVSAAMIALTSLVTTIGKGRRTSVRLAGVVNKALDRVEQIELEARDKKTARERELETTRVRLGAEIAELDKRKAELRLELRRLEQPDKRTLQDFILQRAAADDYRKNLGVVSAVHKDFQELSGFLQPDREGPNVERIILYIDDLDRCSPERVVQVLQAIHVILSLPLFVVVMAVDSRWLLDSLTAYYRQQFPGGAVDAARPQQYLEKIAAVRRVARFSFETGRVLGYYVA